MDINADVHGKAILDYFKGVEKGPLYVHNTYGDKEEMPVEVFFREEEDLSELEHKALQLCSGSILDVGAGAGAVTMMLQDAGKTITALESSANCVDVMKMWGVKNGIHSRLEDLHGYTFDTLLLLMNGIGLAGSLNNLPGFIKFLKTILKEGGQILFDSSDVGYLYENGYKGQGYYGDLRYRFEYETRLGEWFDWLYIDKHTLNNALKGIPGLKLEIVFEDTDTDQYLARISFSN